MRTVPHPHVETQIIGWAVQSHDTHHLLTAYTTREEAEKDAADSTEDIQKYSGYERQVYPVVPIHAFVSYAEKEVADKAMARQKAIAKLTDEEKELLGINE